MEQPNLQDAIRKLRGKPPAAPAPKPDAPAAAPRRRWVAPASAGAAAILSIALGWLLSGSATINDRLENERGKARTVSTGETKAETRTESPDYEIVDTPVFRIYFPKSDVPDWRPGQDLPN